MIAKFSNDAGMEIHIDGKNKTEITKRFMMVLATRKMSARGWIDDMPKKTRKKK